MLVAVLEQASPAYPSDIPARSDGMRVFGLLLSGRLWIGRPDGTRQEVLANQTFWLPEGERFGSWVDRSQPYRDLIAICDHRTSRILADAEAVNSEPRFLKATAGSLSRIQRAYTELADGLAKPELLQQRHTLAAFSRFVLDLEQVLLSPSLIRGVPSEVIERVRERLEAPDAHTANLEVLLEQFHPSFHALRTAFKAATGVTLGQYRIRHRVDRACTMLADGRSITETAEALGYPDVPTFSKQFLKRVGMPPSMFQRSRPRIQDQTLPE